METAKIHKLILDLFKHHEWSIDDTTNQRLFESLYNIGNILCEEDFRKFIFLSYDFVWVKIEKYTNYYNKMGQIIREKVLVTKQRFILLPIIAPKDANTPRAKSGQPLTYNLWNGVLAYLPDLHPFMLDHFLSPSQFKSSPVNEDGCLLVCVDDFIGTGDSAIEFLNDMKSWSPNDHEFFVLPMVAMREGQDKVQSAGFEICPVKVIDKGIQNNPRIINKKDYYDFVDRIEKTLRVSDKNKHGYENSEALISMLRTPNNTFPMYWLSKPFGSKGQLWPAPFHRHLTI